MILKVETTSKNHIDCIIGKGSEGAWRFIGFMGNPILRRDMNHGTYSNNSIHKIVCLGCAWAILMKF